MQVAWPWLMTNITGIAAVVVSFASVVVALVALRMNHRNNWGTSPLVLVVKAGGAQPKGSKDQFTSFTVRIQNRRKYPIETVLLTAKLKGCNVRELLAKDRRLFEGWFLDSDGTFTLLMEGEIEAGKHQLLDAQLPSSLLWTWDVPALSLRYFDPFKGDWRTSHNGWRNRTAWLRRDLRWNTWPTIKRWFNHRGRALPA